MLIQNNAIAPSDVIVIKLPGEEVIGRVVSTDHFGLRITKALRILLQMVPTQNGGAEARVTFAPFVVGVDDDAVFTIETDKLVVKPMKAGNDIAIAYRQQTSALDLPPAPSLLRP